MSSFEAKSTSVRSASLESTVSPKRSHSSSSSAPVICTRRIREGSTNSGLRRRSLLLGRGIELVAQLRAVLVAIARRRRPAPAMLAAFELLGEPDELEMIVSRHGAPSSAARGETVLRGAAPHPPRRD